VAPEVSLVPDRSLAAQPPCRAPACCDRPRPLVDVPQHHQPPTSSAASGGEMLAAMFFLFGILLC